MCAGKTLQIAIDGPAGAGKSTVAKEIAGRMGLKYLDTGAMYRALTYQVLRHGLDPADEQSVTQLVEKTTISFAAEQNRRILCDGEDVTDKIRLSEVTAQVSAVSSYARVRQRMVQLQQSIAECSDVVMDGRDIGTVVLPQASVKIFLTASLLERSKRRWTELGEDASVKTMDDIAAELAERDRWDSQRKISPLKPAEDAYILDTTGKSVDKIVEIILAMAQTSRGRET
ncbi:MAG: (d)CMP kinase [Peptococcaceae bacterium]|nr:(d)CMP kinase [Peptococcaceae bacterium]